MSRSASPRAARCSSRDVPSIRPAAETASRVSNRSTDLTRTPSSFLAQAAPELSSASQLISPTSFGLGSAPPTTWESRGVDSAQSRGRTQVPVDSRPGHESTSAPPEEPLSRSSSGASRSNASCYPHAAEEELVSRVRYEIADPRAPSTTERHTAADGVETNAHVLVVRRKQILLGKVTDGYRDYALAVPVPCRQRKNPLHPSTPRADAVCSKDDWEHEVAEWRRQLLRWEILEGSYEECTGSPPFQTVDAHRSDTLSYLDNVKHVYDRYLEATASITDDDESTNYDRAGGASSAATDPAFSTYEGSPSIAGSMRLDDPVHRSALCATELNTRLHYYASIDCGGEARAVASWGLQITQPAPQVFEAIDDTKSESEDSVARDSVATPTADNLNIQPTRNAEPIALGGEANSATQAGGDGVAVPSSLRDARPLSGDTGSSDSGSEKEDAERGMEARRRRMSSSRRATPLESPGRLRRSLTPVPVRTPVVHDVVCRHLPAAGLPCTPNSDASKYPSDMHHFPTSHQAPLWSSSHDQPRSTKRHGAPRTSSQLHKK